MAWREMLEPQTRATLTELLRPPGGYTLSHAVGTTYTVNLDTALTVPLSFAAQRVSSIDDPISVLDAVRRMVDRVDIFAQAGEASISYPPTRLVAFLEPMFHPVVSAQGIFHPKVWFLEFMRNDERCYRYICSSRNLTGDRSWDLVISLDGNPAPRERQPLAEATNAPITRLLRSLPDLGVNRMSDQRRERIETLANAISGVEWELPDGVESIAHHVWGIGDPPNLSFFGDRALLISPFITQGGITRLRGGNTVPLALVSRPECLNAIRAGYFDDGITCFVIDEVAIQTAPADDADVAESTAILARLEGLHAKIYVFDRGNRAHLLGGSLNATDAALHQNVEAMVELVGRTDRLGVAAITASLGNLIVPYEIDPQDKDALLDQEEDLRIEELVRTLASARYHARVIPGDPHGLEIWLESIITLPADVSVEWYLLHQRARPLNTLPGLEDSPTVINDLELAQVTPFLVVRLHDHRGPKFARTSVVIAELHDDPPDRREAVIASQFTDRTSFLRFLMLLLEIGGVVPTGGVLKGGGWGSSLSGDSGAGLFEMLVRALGAGHGGLKDVHRIVEFLSARGDEAALLPEGFDELWQAVWSAYEQLNPGVVDDER